MDRTIARRGLGYKRRVAAFSLSGLLAAVFLGCVVAPSSDTITETFRIHFAERQYRVISLEIGEIASIPLKEKTYMGRPTYTVQIKSVVMEVPEDIGEPWNYHKGERLTFENAVIHLREPSRSGGNWIIAGLSGIPVP